MQQIPVASVLEHAVEVGEPATKVDRPVSPTEESEALTLESPKVEAFDASKLADMENVSAHNMYLGLETAVTASSSVRSLSISGLSDVTGSDVSSVISGTKSSSGRDEVVDYSVLDRYGFIVVAPKGGGGGGDNGDINEPEEERELRKKQEKRGRKEATRAMKWVDMLKILEFVIDRQSWPKNHKKFERRLVKGVPECLRTKIWALFLEVPPVSSPSSMYRELYLKISGFERQIDLDIERTLRDHILFKARFSSAQVSLFKILVAYSNYDPEVGYCQGMSTIAAFLLLYFEEEMAFNVLRRMMGREDLRTFFLAGFPLLFETFYVQEQLMKKYLPALHARLEGFHISTSVYATKWYLTLFLGFPFSLATRIWDMFLFWGLDMLVCVALALLKLHDAQLMSLEYENCMQFLSKLPDTPIDEQRLIKLTWMIWKRINPHYDQPAPRKNPFAALRLQYGKLVAEPNFRRR
jgi:hypothetical protein